MFTSSIVIYDRDIVRAEKLIQSAGYESLGILAGLSLN